MKDHEHESEDIILDWLRDNSESYGPDCQGHQVINYTGYIYVVLEARKNKRLRYVGWFYIGPKKLDNPAEYNYLGEFHGRYLYRSIDDAQPE